jgi:2,3-dihydroxybenzoate decarboxylase
MGKIAFEEAFSAGEGIPDYVNPENFLDAGSTEPDYVSPDISQRLADLGAGRLAEMDAAGIDYLLLSLTAPGIQAITDPKRAVTLARLANDKAGAAVAAHPTRFGGMAALPMQDPAAAVTELERCVNELGFPAVMLNGFTNIGDVETGWYYDHERYLPFWKRVEELGVPVYIHPRDPLPGASAAYEEHPELFGAVWTFTVEGATHALRLMTSGLFDKFPKLTIILGHLGETLPANMWRIEHRAAKMGKLVKAQKPLRHYLQNNFYVTTSGNFHTPTLNATMDELGSDRVLFSADYPYESMREAADWFDNAAINENDRAKIGYLNARRLFNLPEKIGKQA